LVCRSGSGHESEEFVGDRGCRRRAVEGDRAVHEHLGLEDGPALTDLLAACFAAAWWMKRVMGHEPGLSNRPFGKQREYRSKTSRSSSWFRAMPQTNTVATAQLEGVYEDVFEDSLLS
jgi:hypothetical protein